MKSRRLSLIISFALLTTTASPAFAATASTAIDATKVTIANNILGTKDTITVKGLSKDDVVTAYSDSAHTKSLGTAKSDGTTDAVIQVDQLTQAAGSIYVTLKDAAGDAESVVTKVDYTQEVTPDPDATKITVTNNVDKSDTILFKGLVAKTTAKVYATDGTTLLGSTTATVDGDVTLTLAKQLDESALKVKVSYTIGTAKESNKVDVSYSAAAVTTDPIGADVLDTDGVTIKTPANVIVTNNVDKADTVLFKGLKTKDIAKVYAADKTTILGTYTATKDGDVTVTLTKKLDESALKVFVTVKSDNQKVSNFVEADYKTEAVTTSPVGADVLDTDGVTVKTPANVIVTNNVDKADTVLFKGLKTKDVAKVYAADKTTVLGTFTATKDGDVTVTLAKKLDESALKVFATVKSDNLRESSQVEADYKTEAVTISPIGADVLDTDGVTVKTPANVVVTNNVDKTDTVLFKFLKAKDVAKVYAADGKTVLGTATAAKDGDVTVTLAKKLDESALKVFATVKSDNQRESDQVEADYKAETVTTSPIGADVLDTDGVTIKTPANVIVTNNVDKADTVLFKSLKAKDVAKVYAADGKTVLATATAAKDGDVTVSIPKQLDETALKVKVTVKRDNQRESAQVDAAYSTEAVTTALSSGKITAVGDALFITGVSANDVIKVYDSTGKTVLATGKVSKNNKYIFITLKSAVSTAGVSIKSDNMRESTITAVTFN